VFKENEDLISFILTYVKKLPEKSILVVTSKIVALSEGRIMKIYSSTSRDKFREKIIKKESDLALHTKYSWLTVKDGMVMTSAGIDESNANGKIILLPINSFRTAHNIRKILCKKYKVKNLGILIIDSRKLPTRVGIIGTAIGYAGFKGIKDSRGQPDIFGRILKYARSNVADSLATAAVLCMGEGGERQPLALITDSHIEFTEKINKNELIINLKDDLYLPLFRRILKK